MAWPKGKSRKPKHPEVFIPDSLIPRQVRWDGYGAIRPWMARYAAKEHGCLLSQCQAKYSPTEHGHWVIGPQRDKPDTSLPDGLIENPTMQEGWPDASQDREAGEQVCGAGR